MFDRVPLRYLVPNGVTAGSMVLPRYASAFTPGPAKAAPVASVAVYTLCSAARLARFNVQTAGSDPR
jgi:hypothetical protein